MNIVMFESGVEHTDYYINPEMIVSFNTYDPQSSDECVEIFLADGTSRVVSGSSCATRTS